MLIDLLEEREREIEDEG